MILSDQLNIFFHTQWSRPDQSFDQSDQNFSYLIKNMIFDQWSMLWSERLCIFLGKIEIRGLEIALKRYRESTSDP